MNKKQATINLPLTSLKYLYGDADNKKIVCEIDFSSLKKINNPTTIDEMVAEANLEYHTGQTKKFRSINKLRDYLLSS